MSPKIVDREQRHREILTAAFELFIEKGYHKTTLGEISRAVGIGQGTLYYYFPTKDEIFWGVYDLMMSHMEAGVQKRIQALETPLEKLEEFLKVLFLNFPEVGLFEENATSKTEDQEEEPWQIIVGGFSHVLMEFWLQAERSNQREQFYQRIALYQKAILKDIQKLLEEVGIVLPNGLDHELTAHLLMALHDGLSIQLRMGALQQDNSILHRILNIFLQQLRSQQTESTDPSAIK